MQIYKIFSFCNTSVTFCVTDCCMYIYNFRGKMFHGIHRYCMWMGYGRVRRNIKAAITSISKPQANTSINSANKSLCFTMSSIKMRDSIITITTKNTTMNARMILKQISKYRCM